MGNRGAGWRKCPVFPCTLRFPLFFPVFLSELASFPLTQSHRIVSAKPNQVYGDIGRSEFRVGAESTNTTGRTCCGGSRVSILKQIQLRVEKKSNWRW